MNDITIERSRYYREIQIWPLSESLNYKGWLQNFEQSELEIAKMLLDFFIYYPKNMVNQLLKVSVGQVGNKLHEKFPDWVHSHFKSKCFFTFIPGEKPNASDSGYLFIRKVRNILNIPETQFIDYKDIHQKIDDSEEPLVIIFVDDFVGSGDQCINAWHKVGDCKSERNLNDLAKNSEHLIFYAPLIINQLGYERISKYCQGLILTPTHIIGEEYNLFSENCYCWRGCEEKFKKGIDLIIDKSRALGIDENCIKGYKNQGLAIAFEHGFPDAVLPIFSCNVNWTPLIKVN